MGEAGALWQQNLRLVGLALSTRSGVWHRWQGLMTEHPSQRDLVGTPCPAHPGGAPALWHIHREADPNTNLLLLAVQSRVHISPLHFYPPTLKGFVFCYGRIDAEKTSHVRVIILTSKLTDLHVCFCSSRHRKTRFHKRLRLVLFKKPWGLWFFWSFGFP